MTPPKDAGELFYRILRLVLYAIAALWIVAMLVYLLGLVR